MARLRDNPRDFTVGGLYDIPPPELANLHCLHKEIRCLLPLHYTEYLQLKKTYSISPSSSNTSSTDDRIDRCIINKSGNVSRISPDVQRLKVDEVRREWD